MVDILVRGVDEETARWLKSIAAAEKVSLNEVTRQALEEKARAAKARRDAFWAEVDALREEIGPMPDNAVDLIREDRDSR
jgi:hypothetical protein